MAKPFGQRSLLSGIALVGWLLELYILATFKVISGQILTCNSVQSYADTLGDQSVSGTAYPTHSDTEPIGPCPILIMPSALLGSYEYKFLNHVGEFS